MKNNKFAILILNFNGLRDTIECINSILKSNYRVYDVFCLDNNSKNNEFAKLNNKFKKNKKINIIKSNKNLGFAGGNNCLASKVKLNNYDCLLLLNNDTIVKEDFLSEMNKGINETKDDKIVVFSPTIYYFNNDLKKEKIWRGNKYNKLSNKNERINHLVGCAFFIKSKIVKKYGLFNENFFAYGEELEYFYRLRKKRFIFYYIPRSVIWHKVVEHKDSKLKIYMVARNKWYYWNLMDKWDKLWYSFYFLFIDRFIKLTTLFLHFKKLKIYLKGNLDGLKWIITNKKPKNPFIEDE